MRPGPTLGIISSTPKAPAAHIQKMRKTIPARENLVLCIAAELSIVLAEKSGLVVMIFLLLKL